MASGILSLALPEQAPEPERGPLAVAVEQSFDFAAADYAALHARSQATVFQRPGFIDALHRLVAPACAAEPLTITLRGADTRRLVAVLPLVRRRRRGHVVVEFADFGLCDYLGAIHDPADAARLITDASLPGRIAALLAPCDVLSLTKLRGDDPVLEHLLPRARRVRMRMSTYPAAIAPPFAEWRRLRLGAGFRRTLDMKRRRAAREGAVSFRLARDGAEIAALFAALRRFRAARFHAIGAADVMASDAVFQFYQAIALAGAESGAARTYGLWLDGTPAAVVFGLAGQQQFLLLLVGFDAERSRRLSLGLIAIEDTIVASIAAGDRIYDFTIGDHPYKLQFGAEPEPLYERHAALSARGAAVVLALALVREAKRRLKPVVVALRRRLQRMP
jgi:CelD/BcsL family acetyltransferase involved in cellulose biosynthesis